MTDEKPQNENQLNPNSQNAEGFVDDAPTIPFPEGEVRAGEHRAEEPRVDSMQLDDSSNSETALENAEVISLEKNAKLSYSRKLPLKPMPRYGVCLWWPGNGKEWIHPHDVPKAEDFVPGRRVMLRTDFDDEYSMLAYGDLTIRVRPIMWLPIEFEGFDVGDLVETRSKMGKNDAFVATISEMIWNDRDKRIEYQLERQGRVEQRTYYSDDIVHTEELSTTSQDKEFQLNLDQAKKLQIAQENKSSVG